MELKNIHSIYFLGIGGIGMSALARYFKYQGISVSGYDKTPTSLTRKLQEEGIPVHFEDDIAQIPSNPDLVIYTPAIPQDLREFRYLKNSNVNLRKRSEVLGMLSREKRTIAISGTHGKTTISTMIAHLMSNTEAGCNAFLGGISKNYQTNMLTAAASDWMVVEADEYDKSFLHLEPEIAMITATDADHLDIYGDIGFMKATYLLFAEKIKPGGTLLVKKGVDLNLDQLRNRKVLHYSLWEETDFFAENIRDLSPGYRFDFNAPGRTIRDLELHLPGFINAENAVAALAIAVLTGMKDDEIRSSLPLFRGIERRFDIQFRSPKMVYIDDYAHHPEEIKGVVNSVKAMFPGKKILGIFQPHLYTRTRDFADGFAKSLGLLDSVILLPIYPAREKPIAGVTSGLILHKILSDDKQICSRDEIFEVLKKRKFDILMTLGAGDIDQLVNPVKKFLNENFATYEV